MWPGMSIFLLDISMEMNIIGFYQNPTRSHCDLKLAGILLNFSTNVFMLLGKTKPNK